MIEIDAGADSGPVEIDGGTDAGPVEIAGTCEACETNEDCGARGYCVNLSVGGRACVPGCNPDIPDCPRSFSCTLDISSGVDATVCLPVGGPCCVDEDADTYGGGVGCVGSDCDDTMEGVNPGMSEICNAIDDDCDGMADEPPTDCNSGRCYDLGDGTYEATASGSCMDAMCAGGSDTLCGLYTCEDGGAMGTRCARSCSDMGADVDTFCIATAHCDVAACLDDLPDGQVCDEHGDCESGNCTNGFCCAFGGTCCATTSDCPGAGGIGTICDDPASCQGSRGTLDCAAFQCETMLGIPDDSGCTATTLARDCGLYAPVYCNGGVDQPPPTCAGSCAVDSDCIAAAHCELGVCAPDRPPGASCERNPDCQDGLTCTDGVCCTSSCGGGCESCNLSGTRGTCTTIPALTDPDNECVGFSCSDYYIGFDGARGDACYTRDRVDDAQATCNGAGACLGAPDLCPMEGPLALQIDCNDACQTPAGGTCTGMTAGVCSDDPPGSQICGLGACQRTTAMCDAGRPLACTPGMPTPEVCNGIDDNCDGTADEGVTMLCPATPGVATTMCTPAGTCAIASCASRFYDVDTLYANGCECMDDAAGNTCGAASSLGTVTAGGALVTGGTIPVEGISDFYYVQFPPMSGTFGGGTPRIRLAINDGGVYRLDLLSTCTTLMSCGSGAPAGVSDWSFTDDGGSPGFRVRGVAWPSDVYIRVSRSSGGASCARYQVSVTR
jgi:hypothetical protein